MYMSKLWLLAVFSQRVLSNDTSLVTVSDAMKTDHVSPTIYDVFSSAKRPIIGCRRSTSVWGDDIIGLADDAMYITTQLASFAGVLSGEGDSPTLSKGGSHSAGYRKILMSVK